MKHVIFEVVDSANNELNDEARTLAIQEGLAESAVQCAYVTEEEYLK